MVARLAKSVAFSIVVHVIVLNLQQWTVFTGVSDASRGSMEIRATLFPTPAFATQPLIPEALPAVKAEMTLPDAILPTVRRYDMGAVEQLADGDASQNFFPARQLTRLPFPLSEIDLDVDSIDEVAESGELEFSILIDETGKVVDVSVMGDGTRSSVFVERVAKRFFDSRFSPGEIDGRPVRSQMLILVISELRVSAKGF